MRHGSRPICGEFARNGFVERNRLRLRPDWQHRDEQEDNPHSITVPDPLCDMILRIR
jgi:hypothetical protein